MTHTHAMTGTAHDAAATTDSLKGLAIGYVLLWHYAVMHAPFDARGLASLWVAVFFLLSGYGIGRSMLARAGERCDWRWTRFFRRRAIRIFPLLWFAWVLESVFQNRMLSPWTLAGVHAEGHLWFIPAILQCYLLTPVLVWGLRRRRGVCAAAVLGAFLTLNALGRSGRLPELLVGGLEFVNASWRGLYGLHVVLFVVGLGVASFRNERNTEKRIGGRAGHLGLAVGSALVMLVMLLLKAGCTTHAALKIPFNVVSLALIMGLCIVVIGQGWRSRALGVLGRMSYPIYLLHMVYFGVIDRMAGAAGEWVGHTVLLVTLPVFLVGCYGVNRAAQKLNWG